MKADWWQSGNYLKRQSPQYMAGVQSSRGMEDVKNKQIKAASSIHVRQTAWHGGSLYYQERPKISMEGKWLEKARFFTGNRL